MKTLVLLQLTDNRATERDVTPKVDIASDRQMVEFNDLRDLLKTFLELLDLYRTGQLSFCNHRKCQG